MVCCHTEISTLCYSVFLPCGLWAVGYALLNSSCPNKNSRIGSSVCVRDLNLATCSKDHTIRNSYDLISSHISWRPVNRQNSSKCQQPLETVFSFSSDKIHREGFHFTFHSAAYKLALMHQTAVEWIFCML